MNEMRKIIFPLLFLLMFSVSVFALDKHIEMIVTEGESSEFLINGVSHIARVSVCSDTNPEFCVIELDSVPSSQLYEGWTYDYNDDFRVHIIDIISLSPTEGYGEDRVRFEMIYFGPYCGDHSCSNGESCETCASDCGSCPTSLPKCGDGKCDPGETCRSDRCCDGNKVNLDYDHDNCGNCNYRCDSNQECSSGRCVSAVVETIVPVVEEEGLPGNIFSPYCGDGICNNDENCQTCVSDCGCDVGSDCEDGVCVRPECYRASECNDNNPCTVDYCRSSKCSHDDLGGCNIEDDPKCYRVGDMLGGGYCSSSGVFQQLKNEEESCLHDYECNTDSCKDGRCKGLSGVTKFFIWLRGVFS